MWSDSAGHQFDAPDDGPFTVGRITIEVAGDIDIATAPRFNKLLYDVASAAPTEIVLDFTELDFMDASGLHAMAGAVHRLPPSSLLSLRSPSTLVERLLTITGLQDVIHVESHRGATLAAEQQAGDQSTTVASAPSRLISDLRIAATMPANDEVIDAALRLVVELAASTIDGADGVSVTLRRRGTLTTVAASNSTVAQMDADQYETGEGPCLAATRDGHWFHIDTLEQEHRWPKFVKRATAEGINSVLSTPLMVAAQPVGALNIYSKVEHSFGPSEQERAAWFAAHSSTIVADARASERDETVQAQLQEALNSRETISRAEGVLMGQRAIPRDAASAELRRSARRTDVPLYEYASRVIAPETPRNVRLGQDSL